MSIIRWRSMAGGLKSEQNLPAGWGVFKEKCFPELTGGDLSPVRQDQDCLWPPEGGRPWGRESGLEPEGGGGHGALGAGAGHSEVPLSPSWSWCLSSSARAAARATETGRLKQPVFTSLSSGGLKAKRTVQPVWTGEELYPLGLQTAPPQSLWRWGGGQCKKSEEGGWVLWGESLTLKASLPSNCTPKGLICKGSHIREQGRHLVWESLGSVHSCPGPSLPARLSFLASRPAGTQGLHFCADLSPEAPPLLRQARRVAAA